MLIAISQYDLASCGVEKYIKFTIFKPTSGGIYLNRIYKSDRGGLLDNTFEFRTARDFYDIMDCKFILELVYD